MPENPPIKLLQFVLKSYKSPIFLVISSYFSYNFFWKMAGMYASVQSIVFHFHTPCIPPMLLCILLVVHRSIFLVLKGITNHGHKIDTVYVYTVFRRLFCMLPFRHL